MHTAIPAFMQNGFQPFRALSVYLQEIKSPFTPFPKEEKITK
jgi:hypothetical protein